MLLIHDIPEIIAGDASPLGSDGTGNDSHAYNNDVSLKKFEAEKAASVEIFGKLPKKQTQEMYDLWLEYEKQDCFEAKVVKAIDRFEGKLQASEYRNGIWFKEHLEWTLTYGEEKFAIDGALQELLHILQKEMLDQYTEYKPE
jgi:5'-deoxynucleotidase YfbR-like HD superfamily hydrolase